MATTVTTTSGDLTHTVVVSAETAQDASGSSASGEWAWQLTALSICGCILVVALALYLLQKTLVECCICTPVGCAASPAKNRRNQRQIYPEPEEQGSDDEETARLDQRSQKGHARLSRKDTTAARKSRDPTAAAVADTAPAASGHVVAVASDDQFNTLRAQCADSKLFVFFTASWCKPCKRVAPAYAELAAAYPAATFATVDVDQCGETAESFSVASMPMFAIGSDFLHGEDRDKLSTFIRGHMASGSGGSGGGYLEEAPSATQQDPDLQPSPASDPAPEPPQSPLEANGGANHDAHIIAGAAAGAVAGAVAGAATSAASGGGGAKGWDLAAGEATLEGAAHVAEIVAMAAGSMLLEAARSCPVSAPLAYAIGTVVSMCQSATCLKADAMAFGDVVKEVEKMLVQAGNLKQYVDPIRKIQLVLDEAGMFLSKLQGKQKWKAIVQASNDRSNFEELRGQLNEEISVVALKVGLSTAGLLQQKFVQEVELSAAIADLGGEQALADKPELIDRVRDKMDASDRMLLAMLDKERERVDHLESQVSSMRSEMEERMAVQADLIAMQAKQMQALMEQAKGALSLSQCSANYPRPAHLADAVLVLRRRDLAAEIGPERRRTDRKVIPEFEEIKSWMDSVTASWNGQEFVGSGYKIKSASWHVFKDADMEFCPLDWTNDSELGKRSIRVFEVAGYGSRKLVPCQYVDAIGEMVCCRNFGANKAFNPFADSETLMARLQALDDVGLSEGAESKEYMGNLFATMGGQCSLADPDDQALLGSAFGMMQDPNFNYIGVPLQLDGTTVGSICVFWMGDESVDPKAEGLFDFCAEVGRRSESALDRLSTPHTNRAAMPQGWSPAPPGGGRDTRPGEGDTAATELRDQVAKVINGDVKRCEAGYLEVTTAQTWSPPVLHAQAVTEAEVVSLPGTVRAC